MPNVDLPDAWRWRMTSAASIALIPFMHAAKAPTPGTTSPSDLKATSRSDVSCTSWPVVANARWADRKFPDP